jgi:hypothetical protein
MKKTSYIIVLFFISCVTLLSQPHKMSSIQRIIQQSFVDIKEGEESNLVMHQIQYNKISGGEWKRIYCELNGGVEYIVFVQGENGQVLDLDLKIYGVNDDGLGNIRV